MRNILWVLLIFCTNAMLAQVKVGDNINIIDANSILELESSNKVFVVSRMTTDQMNAITPLNGAMVYNTEVKCLFVFEGTVWKTLCDSEIAVTTDSLAPTDPKSGDIWFNDTSDIVSVWDGLTWVPIPQSKWNGDGAPSASIIPNPVAGDVYVDTSNSDFYTYDGTTWVSQRTNAANGLNETANKTIALGGPLIKATEISTDPTNTLALSGLSEISDNTNQVVTIEPTTGILRRSSISAFLEQEETVIIANNNQTQFTPPLAVTSSKKLNVYRNGVKLGFTIIDATTIELESPVFCYENDEIRIVQFY